MRRVGNELSLLGVPMTGLRAKCPFSSLAQMLEFFNLNQCKLKPTQPLEPSR
ncbi:hypothetical protein SAMN06265368_2367 [Cohaesibacter gelatinilyticus]|uniref:Uncharacterized protein n=1 Tax=Cohaesibacter gelatinilyticus TaxID=372072 RepID=A0A285PC26_9HYPH|nr:hypothetical protein SAMN06265368_2367 [Cohaesibacter gelatinilyticus]